MDNIAAAISLAQVKLEDVFRSTQENMQAVPGSDRLLTMGLVILLGAAALILIAHIRRRQATQRPTNHPGRLLRELRRAVPLSRREVAVLRAAAAQVHCSNPAALLLCPSVLAKAAEDLPPGQRQTAADLLRRLETSPGDGEPESGAAV